MSHAARTEQRLPPFGVRWRDHEGGTHSKVPCELIALCGVVGVVFEVERMRMRRVLTFQNERFYFSLWSLHLHFQLQ